jgi:hypothetical protein
MISSLTEHTRKCLKFVYLGRIEYDFQKSRVTGSWDHKDSVSAKKVFKKIHACVPLTDPLTKQTVPDNHHHGGRRSSATSPRRTSRGPPATSGPG